MKTYKTKASAKRAMVTELVKKNGVEKEAAVSIFNECFEMIEEADGFWARRIQVETKMEATGDEDFELGNSRQEMAFTEAGDAVPADQIEKNMVQIEINQSTIVKPCNQVWEIAIQMHEASDVKPARKDIIAECVRQGVAFNTARTQYQAWFKANKA